jgi:nuclear pore complex protein Nup50
MAGKRVATTDLNHDNWNDEEEAEAPGVFKKASENELQKRVIISAKRRIATNSGKTVGL